MTTGVFSTFKRSLSLIRLWAFAFLIVVVTAYQVQAAKPLVPEFRRAAVPEARVEAKSRYRGNFEPVPKPGGGSSFGGFYENGGMRDVHKAPDRTFEPPKAEPRVKPDFNAAAKDAPPNFRSPGSSFGSGGKK